MKIRHFIIGGAMAMALTSCATKESAVNQLESFSYELRDNSRYYDMRDWEKAGEKFVKITKTIKKHERDYTPAEKKRIGELEGECAGYMARGAMENDTDRMRNIYNEIRGIMEGIGNVFGK